MALSIKVKYYFFLLVVDGGWTSYQEEIDDVKNCTRIVRSCTNPTPCGNGAECIGEKFSNESTCPSKFSIYYILLKFKILTS